MEELAETSLRKGPRKEEWVKWLGGTNVIDLSSWTPQQSALKVSADQDPMHMLAALKQRKHWQ